MTNQKSDIESSDHGPARRRRFCRGGNARFVGVSRRVDGTTAGYPLKHLLEILIVEIPTPRESLRVGPVLSPG